MKRIFSIILAIVMLIGILPAAFAVGETDGYEYVFTKEAVNPDASGNMAGSELVGKIPIETVSDKWQVAGSFYISNKALSSNGLIFNADHSRAEGDCIGCFGLKITVSEEGTYIPSLTYSARNCAPKVDIYLVKEGTMAGSYGDTSKIQFDPSTNGYDTTYYYITNLDNGYKLKKLDMWGDSTLYTNKVTENFDNIELELEAGEYYLLFRTVGKNDGFVKLEGTYLEVCLESFTLTPAYTAEAYATTPNATVTALAAYGDGNAVVDADVISVETAEYGKKCNVSVKNKTVEKNGTTYNFLYWAKGLNTRGNELALSTAESFDYIPQDGNNVLIAVYEEANAAEETATFYNANGQLLTDIEFNGTVLPTLPSMTGYTAPATAWVQLGNDAELKAGDPVPETGDKIFMAKYTDSAKKTGISVTVTDASSDSTPTGAYTYGKEIICKADTTKAETFMYWTKTVGGADKTPEVVSMNENYSFYAWEDCVVTAVYGDTKPVLANDMRKIIISSVVAGADSAIMAEFIGFGDALEKGVMVDGRKIAMTTKDNQFTVVTSDDVTGYAIINDNGLKKITDGELTVSAE